VIDAWVDLGHTWAVGRLGAVGHLCAVHQLGAVRDLGDVRDAHPVSGRLADGCARLLGHIGAFARIGALVRLRALGPVCGRLLARETFAGAG
jgi:hypothetical protein